MSTEIATTGELFSQAWEQYKIRALVVNEEMGIMDALHAGWLYFQPMSWMMSILFGIILAGIIPFAGQVFSFLFTPFLMLYLLAIYRNLKAVKGENAVVTTGPAGRLLWSCLAALGLLLPVVGLLAVLAAVVLHGQEWLLELRQLMGPAF